MKAKSKKQQRVVEVNGHEFVSEGGCAFCRKCHMRVYGGSVSGRLKDCRR